MTVPQDLIERVRKATGPDAGLDLDISLHLRGLRNTGGYWAEEIASGKRFKISYAAEPITASIDAALALVERVVPGKAVLMGYGQTDGTKPWARIGEWHDADATGANLALAILSALLSLQSEADK